MRTAVLLACFWGSVASALSEEVKGQRSIAADRFASRKAVEFTARGGIGNVMSRIRSGQSVKIAYFGGSITEMDGWRRLSREWLEQRYPGVSFFEIRAAIGGTASGLGVFRYGHDVLAHEPDLVFVEFVANDFETSPQEIRDNFDGIVRQTWLRNPRTDIVFVYVITDDILDEYLSGKLPLAADAMEDVADHYGIPSICFGPRVIAERKSGRLVMSVGEAATAVPDEVPDRSKGVAERLSREGKILFSTDGTHPCLSGHAFYLASITNAWADMEKMSREGERDHVLPKPLSSAGLDKAKMIPVARGMLVGDSWQKLGDEDQLQKKFRDRCGGIWQATKPGDRMVVRFRGTECRLYDLIGPACCRVNLTVDGKRISKPVDCFDSYCTYYRLAELPIFKGEDGLHVVEVEIDPVQPDRKLVLARSPNEPVTSSKYNGTRLMVGQVMLVGELDNEPLARLAAADIVEPVRPGGDGRPFWNAHALWFMYPPAFDFKTVPTAVDYRFSIRDNFQREWTMSAAKPTVPIVDVWTNLPPGLTVATCYGVDRAGEVVGLAGCRAFWKQASYVPGSYPAAKCSYAEAADRLLRFLVLNWQPSRVLEKTGRPDFTYQFNSYPAKMGSAYINAMLLAARRCPDLAERAIGLAKKEAAYLLDITPKEGCLAYFTPTYEYHANAGEGRTDASAVKQTCRKLAGTCMIRYAAEVGMALLRLSQVTGDASCSDFAVRCGETFVRRQRPDGTWPCVMRYSDGKGMRRDDAILIERVNFFTMLHDLTGDARFEKLERDVLAQVENGPMRTWDWQGQFEDTPLQQEPYRDLSGTDALPAACYVLTKFPGEEKWLRLATELVRFGEDQFTFWEKPWRADGGSPKQIVSGRWYDNHYSGWRCPGVGEQYACIVPIDASACRMIWGYLALYRATGNELYAAKARTLGDSLVNQQQANGGIETYWYDTWRSRKTDDCAEIDWLDCMYDDAEALVSLDEAFGGK